MIAWLAKATDSDFPGDQILMQAAATALEVVEIAGQGQVAITLGPGRLRADLLSGGR